MTEEYFKQKTKFMRFVQTRTKAWEWLVSDEKAVQQLTQYFKEKNIDIVIKLFKE